MEKPPATAYDKQCGYWSIEDLIEEEEAEDDDEARVSSSSGSSYSL